jgi:hypothetical protein
MARERKRDTARAEPPTPLLPWRQIKPRVRTGGRNHADVCGVDFAG